MQPYAPLCSLGREQMHDGKLRSGEASNSNFVLTLLKLTWTTRHLDCVSVQGGPSGQGQPLVDIQISDAL